MDYITTTQAAEKLGVSRARVYQLIAEGKLTAEKVGRDYLIRESALKGVVIFGKSGRPSKKSSKS